MQSAVILDGTCHLRGCPRSRHHIASKYCVTVCRVNTNCYNKKKKILLKPGKYQTYSHTKWTQLSRTYILRNKFRKKLCSPNSPFLTFFCHLFVSAVAFFNSCFAFLYSVKKENFYVRDSVVLVDITSLF